MYMLRTSAYWPRARMSSTCCLAATALLSLRLVPWPTMSRLVSFSGTPGATSRARRKSKSVIECVVAHGRAIMPALAGVGAHGQRGGGIEAEFARDDGTGKVSLADKIRHDVHVTDRVRDRIQQRPITHGRFLLPEHAAHLREQPAPADRGGMGETRGARVRIDRRTMANDEQGGV